MPSTVRVSNRAWKALKEIAEQTGETMQGVLERAVEAYRRQWLLERANKAYAALRSDPEKWDEEVAERREWEAPLADGLEGSE
ncbi:hypothetical protein Tph_c24130 [Thermacetogenium phaeum DSM 12270]|uniref:Uncharacterized protein n=1 Tax=Thermacetogenium phaeum (strain ATCC BAA-254 / DSM 26808 / PB) TaxID=1089553 RepID=K4LKU6_THEPS|nr:hypothetical protein [Thermacetogenium phaeum]AFV12600.1 hypothetical protein Tph_c24130 [Thermacetogenium phaeum DSM 12270]